MDEMRQTLRTAALEKIARMCSEEAAKSLSEFSANTVTVDDVTIRSVPMESIPSLFGDPEDVMVGINLAIEGDINGYVLSSFNLEDAAQLVESLVGERPEDITELDELSISALGETGNIIVGALLRALNVNCGLDVLPCPPSVVVDMRGAILTSAVLPVLELGGEILMQEARIRSVGDGESMSCCVMLLPTAEGWEILQKAVGATL